MKPRRVASFVESLMRNRRPRAFEADTEDAEAIRAAVELRGTQPGGAEPTDQFVRELQERLRERLGTAVAGPVEGVEQEEAIEGVGGRTLSRRRLLEGAGIAASAAFIAVVTDRVIEHGPAPQEATQQPMVPDGGRWVTVTTADRVDAERITAFATDDVVGFVVKEGETLRALSGICTHQGCVLRANEASSRLDCPCHRAAFSLDGQVLFHEFDGSLRPLPTLRVRRAGNDVEVLLPPPQNV